MELFNKTTVRLLCFRVKHKTDTRKTDGILTISLKYFILTKINEP